MNIRHECPLPDLSFAVAAPLFVQTADGTVLTVRQWSLEGICIDPAGHDLTQHTALGVPFQGVDITFPVYLAATDAPDRFTFKNLTVRQRETLATFYRGILSGKMASVGEVITSLDTPVDLVPMGETEQEKTEGLAKAKPRSLRAIWNVLFYTLLALFLGWFVGGHMWERLSRLTLDHGRFVAPITQYEAPDSGYIERLYVRVGETVKRGDVIARLEDPDRESDVEEVRAEIMIAERRLEDAQAALDRHIASKPQFRAPLLQAFELHWRGLRDHHPGTGSASAEARLAKDELLKFDSGYDIGPGGYHTILGDLTGQVSDLELEMRRWKRELRHRKAAADRYVIRAATAGTVFAVPVQKGDYVGRGDLVAEIEEDTPRTAVGWLDDQMVTSVYVGMPATVQFSFRGEAKAMAATVVEIHAGADAIQPDRFGMLVTLKVEDAGLKTSRKLFRRNAPARISLRREPFAHVWGGSADASS